MKLTSPRDYVLGGIGVTMMVGGNYVYSHKSDWPVDKFVLPDPLTLNRFDRSAIKNYSLSAGKASDVFLISSLALPGILMFDRNMRRDAFPITAAYLQSTFITGAEIQLVKGLVHRLRPFVYNESVPITKKMKADAGASFFSGHTAMTASAAAFTATVYSVYHPNGKELPYVYAAAAAIPLTTGYLRYKAGNHFPTDIIVGYLVGVANGFLIAELHRR